MQTEPPVTLNQTKNVMRKSLIISSIVFTVILVLFQKQEVQAAVVEEDINTFMVEQALPMEYTDEELMTLATVIHAEAGICSDAEKYRVGNVVLNRVNDTEHNEFKDVNTIEEVIYQKLQFTCVGGNAWKEGPTEDEIEIASELLEGTRVLPDYVVWFSKKHNFGEEYHTSQWHVFSGWEQEEE